VSDTAQQTAFINHLCNTRDNIALVARAGTGKTTTILRGVAEYHKRFPYHEITVCAYNKAIADEVGAKLKAQGHVTDWVVDESTGRKVPPRIQASTLHALGYGLIRNVFKSVIDEDKVKKLIAERNDFVYREYGAQIAALVGYAKGAGVGFFSDLPMSSPHTWFDLADHYDVNGVDDMEHMEWVVEAAQSIYKASLDMVDVIDFDDMILFPLIKNIVVKWGKDLIFLDEAQDLSRARQALARKFLKTRNGQIVGRMMIVGDDRQAIYGFSGADAAALKNLTRGLNAVELPLSITWRCPRKVVKLAQTIVPDIQAAPNAAEGEVLRVADLPDTLYPTDAILCRNTAPLITAAYKLIRRGVPCKVEGRSIGQGLEKLVTRWKVRTIDALLNKLELYREREVQKAVAKGSEAKAEEVNDKCETLKEICNAVLAKGKHSVDDVRQFINELFADGAKGVLTLATYHRSKGREWKRVFLWEHTARCPSRAARQPWQLEQEMNLAYVAYTRAMESLIFVG
jgi:DNA helicase II / ATP-dependent DNA helicase PcrA